MSALAAILTFCIPGLGQIIQGRVLRGIAIFFGVALLMPTLIGALILWIWAIRDAYIYQPRQLTAKA